jgi:hypothetical protein
MEHDFHKAVDMNLILCIFKQLTGLKIIFHKSKFFYFRKEKDDEQQYNQIFGSEVGLWPFQYLVINFITWNGTQLISGLLGSLVVGKASCFHMETDWF